MGKLAFLIFVDQVNALHMSDKADLLYPEHPILLFDGVCNMCSGFVQFVIKIDPKGKFRFASLQSDTGKELLTAAGLSTRELGTVVLINKGKAHTHSDVALESARILGGGWTLFYVFKVLPRFIRDGIYKWIARNRYRWFGKKESCMMPSPDIRQRFLEVG